MSNENETDIKITVSEISWKNLSQIWALVAETD